MLHGTSQQAASNLLQAQMRLFEEAARLAGLSDDARNFALRQALGPHDRGDALAGCAAPSSASPDLLRRIGHLTFRLIVQSEQPDMTA